MLERFKQYISEEKLIESGEKTLLAASAGVDSTVLCHLFQAAKLPFAIAHCNFQLRGADSEGDALFVKNLAAQFEVPFVSTSFDTLFFAKNNKLSVQEAARQLRYEWIEKMRPQLKCSHIATAHHLDDSIETVLFNFARGCGIRGMHGILPHNGRIIRPLLFATKSEILEFAKNQNISFREDVSNLKDKYSRNKIRLQAIPVFEKINPSFQKSAAASIERLRQTAQLLDFAVQTIRQKVLHQQGDEWTLDIAALRSYPALPTVLYELLLPFGFNAAQVGGILQSMDRQPGQRFDSQDWCLLSDRSFLFLKKREPQTEEIMIPALPSAPVELPNGSHLLFRLEKGPPPTFPPDPKLAWLDLDTLSFPLKLRHWQQGDSFLPLGMSGRRQKLQDFFSNRKLSRFEKEKVWLLESGGAIAWVIGLRLDERFKITATTKRFLVVRACLGRKEG